jgi:hypothetical protein
MPFEDIARRVVAKLPKRGGRRQSRHPGGLARAAPGEQTRQLEDGATRRDVGR